MIADLQGARALSWQGFDASDYAAALVARMKTGPGSVYLTEDPDRHGDREFHYEVRGAGREIAVAVHSFRFRTEFSLRPVAQVIFEGSLDEAAARFESGPVHSERADMLARVWPALEAAEMALSDFETAPAGRASDSERESPQTRRRKGYVAAAKAQIYGLLDARREELRASGGSEAPEIKTRADLARLPVFCDLPKDTSGNPCVWMNFYECGCGACWDDTWSCKADDDCGRCGETNSPTESAWLGPSAGRASDSERESPQTKMSAYELWESLPEKAR